MERKQNSGPTLLAELMMYDVKKQLDNTVRALIELPRT